MDLINVLIYEPYPFNQVSGNLRTQSYIMEFVDKDKFHLIFMSPFETDFTKKVQSDGVDTFVLQAPERVNRYGGKCLRDGYFGKILTIIDLFRYNLRLYKVLRKKKIDIVYCNCIRGVLTVGLAAIMTRSSILWYVKGELQNKFLDTIGFVMADKILFQCKSNKHDKYPKLIKRYDNKVGILGTGINPESIIEVEKKDKAKLKDELSVNDENINIIFLGQLYTPKGVHYLLEAMALIVNEFPRIMLFIVGDHVIDEYKRYKAELYDIIKRSGLDENVIFTGWRTDALEILSLMDVLVHPSLMEGFSRVVIEAMAFGKAVVCTGVGGSREIIKDSENGFLVEPGDPQMIAEKLSLLLRNKNLRDNLGKAARDTVFSEYLIQDKIVQLEEIWSDMAAVK